MIGGRRLSPEEVFPGGDGRFCVRWVDAGRDLRLRVVECAPSDAAQADRSSDTTLTRPVVVCVHGWGCSAYSYRAVLPELAQAGYRVIALDLPGHGESSKPSAASAYTLDALTDAVIAVCSALSLTRILLVGHSMGGPIVMEVARRAPPLVSAVVLLAPVGFGRTGHLMAARVCTPLWMRGLLPYVTPKWVAWVALHSAYGSVPEPTARDLDEYWAPSRSPNFVRALQRLLHDFPWRAGEDGRWRETDVPVRVLRGAKDPLVSLSGVEGYRQAVTRCAVEAIAECGHAVPDEVPERVVGAILAMAGY